MKVNYDSWESSALLRLINDDKLLSGFDDVKREVDNIDSECDACVKVGEEIIRMLEGRIAWLLATIKELQSKVSDLKSKLASVPRTETVKRQVPDGNGGVKTVTETHAINQGLISNLNAEIEEINEKIRMYQGSVARLEDLKAEAEHAISELRYSSGAIGYARDDIEYKRRDFDRDLEISKKHVKYAAECMERYNHVRIDGDGFYKFQRIPSKRS